MARLTGLNSEKVQADRNGIAAKYAKAARAVVVLKGQATVITDGSRTAVNGTGNPGMATAGSGDVLAGVIAALVAQGMDAFEAARLGVHLHGAAGDLGAAALGTHGLLAGDIIGHLPAAFRAHAGDA